MSSVDDRDHLRQRQSAEEIVADVRSGTPLRLERRWDQLHSPHKPQYEARLLPLWLTILLILALTAGFATVVTILGLVALHVHGFQHERELSPATLYDLIKVALAVGAGVGAIVVLIAIYRRQRIAEASERRESARLFNERFAVAAGQLGHDSPAVRLAGVYAMAGLADDWLQQRQTCVDILCAFLRMPYEPQPPVTASASAQRAYTAAREVRHTAIRVIAAHLGPGRSAGMQDWRAQRFDFSGAIFDGGDFSQSEFRFVKFTGAHFAGGRVDFNFTRFAGSWAYFTDTEFTGGKVDFYGAQFISGLVDFSNAHFAGGYADFTGAQFLKGTVSFLHSRFTGGTVDFHAAQFGHGRFAAAVSFTNADFQGADVRFLDIFGDPPFNVLIGNDLPTGVTLSLASRQPR